MDRESLLTDVRYAMGQLRAIEDGSDDRKARDRACRALDALERVEAGLLAPPVCPVCNTEYGVGLGCDCNALPARDEALEALKGVLAGMPFGANWDANGNNPEWLKEARRVVREGGAK